MIRLVLAALALALAFGTGWKVCAWKNGAERTAETEREMQVLAARARTVDAAAARHEGYKAAAKARERQTKPEVDRVVQAPVYRNECISPDGMRILEADIAARRAPAGKSAPAVPGNGPAERPGRDNHVPVDEVRDQPLQRMRELAR